jgi:translation initiation factor IF-3
MDFGKFKFESKKQQAANKKKQKQVQIKEIKFRPRTEAGDYLTKVRKLREFLENGDKAKVTLRYRGREFAHQELGLQLLQRVGKDLEEYGIIDQMPKMEGRQMVMMISPKKTK